MNWLGNVVAGLVATAAGFGLAFVRETKSDDHHTQMESPPETLEVVTFTGSSGEEANSQSGFNARFGIVPYTTFREGKARLEELVSGLGYTSGYTQMFDPAHEARTLEEIENILSMASEKDLTQFLNELDFSEHWHASAIGITLATLARKSPSRAIEAGIAQWEKDEVQDYAGLPEVLRVLYRNDPAGAERWVESITDNKSLQSAAFHFLLTLDAAERPEKILRRLGNIDPASGSGIAAVLGEKLPSDQLPAAAEMLLAEREDGTSSVKMLEDFLLGWSSREPEVMVDWLLEQDLSQLDEQQLQMSLSGILSHQPELLLAKLAPALSSQPKLTPIAGFAWWQQLAKEGGETAAMSWLAENMKFATGFGEWQIADRGANGIEWTPEQTTRILDAWTQLPTSDTKDSFSQGFLERLSRFQPEVVLPYAMEYLPLGSQTNSTISHAVASWARLGDPQAAMEWSLENLESHGALDDAVRFAASNWAEQDPKAAAEFALSLPESVKSDAFTGLAYEWPTNNAGEFLDFVQSAPDPEAISSLTKRGFWTLAQRKGGTKFLSNALEMPPGKTRHDAIRGLFGGWSQSVAGPAEAVERIDDVPEGSLRNAAIFGFNDYEGRRDPALAMKLAAKISNPAARDRELILRGKAWLKQDPSTAAASIRRNSTLPSDVKKQLLESVETSR